MDTLSTVLETLIQNSGVSESALARRMGITVATLNKIKSGIMSNPTLRTLESIAQYFGISIDQLVGNAPLDTYFQNNLHCIPFVDISSLEKTNIQELNYDTHKDWMRVELLPEIKSHNIFTTMYTGDAMYPLLDKQTIVVIDADNLPTNKSLVLAYISNTKELLIRKLLVDGAYQILKPLNQSFPDINLTEKDKILGTVISTIKNHDSSHL